MQLAVVVFYLFLSLCCFSVLFQQWFTRDDPNIMETRNQHIIKSPCYGKIQKVGFTNQCSIVNVKQQNLSLQQVFGQPVSNGFYFQIYLRLWDNHRIVAPVDMTIIKKQHIPGPLHPVALDGQCRNERIVLLAENNDSVIYFAFVGAFNVGGINIHDKLTFQQGEELGWFSMGSTVAALFTPKIICQCPYCGTNRCSCNRQGNCYNYNVKQLVSPKQYINKYDPIAIIHRNS